MGKRNTHNRSLKPAWKNDFLAALREDPNVSAAAVAVGKSRRYTYEAKDADPDFAAAWDDAIAASVDSLESRVFQATQDLSTSPAANMAMFLLRAHRPERYSEKTRAEVTGKDGGPIELSEVKAALLRGVVPDATD